MDIKGSSGTIDFVRDRFDITADSPDGRMIARLLWHLP